jgi:hypothetical protein
MQVTRGHVFRRSALAILCVSLVLCNPIFFGAGPAWANSESGAQKLACTFLKDTDFADNQDVIRAVGKFLDGDGIDAGSFFLFGLHAALSHLWCNSIPENKFTVDVTKTQKTLASLIKVHPLEFNKLTASIDASTGHVMMPLVSAFLDHQTDTPYVHVSWLRKGSVNDAWVELCSNYRCRFLKQFAQLGNPLFQGASIDSVPVNQACQIYVQPDTGAPPAPHAWVGTVRFEIVESVEGHFTLVT